jgi:hypothetical protein
MKQPDVDVISAQFPCGAAWLANALLELDVHLPELWGFDTAGEWQHAEDGSSTYVAAHLPWQQTLASLQLGRRFRFRATPQVRFGHVFPWQLSERRRTILIVRDPRDALYSEWQRHRRNRGLDPTESIHAFSARPFEHGPIDHIDLLWLHTSCWLLAERDPADLLLLRFEDFKRAPDAALHAVCAWLDLPVSAPDIARAVRASDVSRLQQIEAGLRDADASARQFNRRGMAFEWRERWPPTWHTCIGPHWHWLLDALGYPPPICRSGKPRAFDLRATLAWRELDDEVRVAAWARRIDAPIRGELVAGFGTATGAAVAVSPQATWTLPRAPCSPQR